MANSKTSKKRSSSRRTSGNGSLMTGLMPVINGALFAAALTVALIMVLAVLLKFGLVKETVIPIVNQGLKVICIAFGAFLSVQGSCAQPWFRGLLTGVLYIALGYIIFSLIMGSFTFSIANIADLIMGAVVGGIIAFIFGKRKEA